MKRGIWPSLLLTLVLSCSPVWAAPPSEAAAYGDMISWLSKTLKAINQLGADIDRIKLVNYLDDLGSSFEEMLRDKRTAIKILAVKPIDGARLRPVLDKSRNAVYIVDQRLRNVAFVLKQQDEGAPVVHNLVAALNAKESWVNRLSDSNKSDAELTALSGEIKAAEIALAKAVDDLARLTKSLKPKKS